MQNKLIEELDRMQERFTIYNMKVKKMLLKYNEMKLKVN